MLENQQFTVKVKLPLFLTKNYSYVMKTYGMQRSGFFLTSARARGKWSGSWPYHFTPGERASSSQWIGDWVAPELVWTMWKREHSLSYWDSNSNLSVVQPVESRWVYCTVNFLSKHTLLYFGQTHKEQKYILRNVNDLASYLIIFDFSLSYTWRLVFTGARQNLIQCKFWTGAYDLPSPT
jgi:hypothetical protein